MFSKIAIGFGLIIMVVAGGIYYLSQNAGKIVESMIEEQGSHVMKVDVQLDAVELNFPDLKASIRGLTVANPEGFQTERAISLGEISVKMAKDWPSDLIVIEEVMINAPEITYEIGSGGSNIATIQKNVEDFMKAISSQKKKSGIGLPSNEKDQSKGPKIIINDFYLKNG
ncbi:MAG: hypothetical protein JKY27_08375, partial [Magnetovibrio sp.]|nr:hypothetical protein [Magnetovibrio sp.]